MIYYYKMVIEVDSLIKNIKKPDIPYTLDIILEPGSFNGAYEVGGLIFIRELEKNKYFKVGRISGSSIGAFAGFLYFTNNLDRFVEIYDYLRKSFLEKVSLYKLKEVLLGLTNNIDDEKFKLLQEDKLFISTYDVQKMHQIIKSKFKTREEIVDCILKSCHLPLLIDGHIFFESNGKYFFDGGMPYIFKMRESEPKYKIIYLSITTLGKMKRMFNLRSEKSIHGRILEGIIDVYTFFHKGEETAMTSFVHNWTWHHFMRLRILHFIILYINFNMIIIHKFIKFIHPKIKDIDLYKHFTPFFKNIYNDMLLYLLFK